MEGTSPSWVLKRAPFKSPELGMLVNFATLTITCKDWKNGLIGTSNNEQTA